MGPVNPAQDGSADGSGSQPSAPHGNEAFEDEDAIYQLAERCEGSFENLISVLSTTEHCQRAQDYQHRFERWTGYLGVFAAYRASLDNRLSSSPQIRDLVVRRLEIIERNIQHCIVFETKSPENAPPSKNEGSRSQPISPATVAALDGIKDALDGLQRLGAAIRKSSTADLVSRVKRFEQRAGSNRSHEGMDLLVVKGLYPSVTPSLAKQLSESIAFRRARLEYQKFHQTKLETRRTRRSKNFKQGEPQATSRSDTKPVRRDSEGRSVISSRIGPSVITDPSKADESRIQRHLDSHMDDEPEMLDPDTSGPMTVSSVARDNPYPRPPKPYQDREGFCQCDWCFSELLVPEDKTEWKHVWRAHFKQDLQAYVCISEDCNGQNKYFSSLKSWREHMNLVHTMEWPQEIHKPNVWYCDLGSDEYEEFNSPQELRQHLLDHHKGKLNDYEREATTRRNVVPVSRLCNVCPLCNVDITIPPRPPTPLLESPSKTEESIINTRRPFKLTENDRPAQKTRFALPDDDSGSDQDDFEPSEFSDSDSIGEETRLNHIKLTTHIAGHLKSLAFQSLKYFDDVSKTVGSEHAASGAGVEDQSSELGYGDHYFELDGSLTFEDSPIHQDESEKEGNFAEDEGDPDWMYQFFGKNPNDEPQAIGEDSRDEPDNDDSSTPQSPQSLDNDIDSLRFPRGFKVWHDPPDALFEICFIHGFTGDRDSAWTADGEDTPWPQAMLPTDVPMARLLTYGYHPFRRVQFLMGRNIKDLATEFLADFKMYRKKVVGRASPLILVAHGIGGLMCKFAMARPGFPSLRENLVKGFFFATPYMRYLDVDWASVHVSSLGLKDQADPSLWEILGASKDEVLAIEDYFSSPDARIREDYKNLEMIFFYETQPMPPIQGAREGQMIVRERSSTPPGYPSFGLERNHSNIIKFTSTREFGYTRLLQGLEELRDSMKPNPVLQGSINRSISRYELTEVYKHPEAKVDIVLVHGLNGSPDKTWTAKNGVFWPTDLLPTSLGNAYANILTYGYNSDWFSSRTSSVGTHAQTLLQNLSILERSNETSKRPIIWVCHSLGGLIVKKALLLSKHVFGQSSELSRSIYISTFGLIFFGTPHKESGSASAESIPQSLLKMVLPDESKNTTLLSTLKENSETLGNINKEFLDIYGRFRIYMIHENHKTDLHGSKALVVDQDSASPQLPGVTSFGIEATHSGMCKFDSATAPGYAAISYALREWVLEAPEIIRTRWAVDQTERGSKPPAQTTSPGLRDHLDATKGPEVVFCHACSYEWFRDEYGLTCPQCGADLTEIIDLNNDPRDLKTKSASESHTGEEAQNPQATQRAGNVAPDALATVGQETSRARSSSKLPDVWIGVMGRPGSGKTRFISHCAGQDMNRGLALNDVEPRNLEARIYKCGFHMSMANIYLVDFPAFEDLSESADIETLREIATWLTASYKNNIRLTGILYLHPITQNRFTGTDMKHILMLEKLCGLEAIKGVTLVTTFWDSIDPNVGERRFEELQDRFWGSLVQKGAQTRKHNNTRQTALKILESYIRGLPAWPPNELNLAIQIELVDQGKTLIDTEAVRALISGSDQALTNLREKFVEQQILLDDVLQRRHAGELGNPDSKITEDQDIDDPVMIGLVDAEQRSRCYGRNHELEDLASKLEFRTGATSTVLVSGAPGLGKSFLVREYVFSCRHIYRTIFWIRGGTLEDLENACSRIFKKAVAREQFGSQGYQQPPPPASKIIAVRDWLRQTTGWLLVLDGMPTEILVSSEFTPSASNTALIIITTDSTASNQEETRSIYPSLQVLAIEPLRKEDAQAMLLEEIGKDAPWTQADMDLAGEAVSLLERSPLAITTMIGYLRQSGKSLREYMKSIVGSPHEDYTGQLVSNAWTLESLNAEAVDLMHILMFFDTEIPVELLRFGSAILGSTGTRSQPALLSDSDGRPSIERTLKTLASSNLIQRSNPKSQSAPQAHAVVPPLKVPVDPRKSNWEACDTIKIHRAVQQTLRGHLALDKYISWLARAVEVFATAWDNGLAISKTNNRIGTMEDFQNYKSHCERMTESLRNNSDSQTMELFGTSLSIISMNLQRCAPNIDAMIDERRKAQQEGFNQISLFRGYGSDPMLDKALENRNLGL